MKKRVLALVDDLFFSTQIKDTAAALGYETVVARGADELARLVEEGPGVVLVDSGSPLDWPRLVAEARAHGHPVVVFGNHNDLEARSRALVAGASAFVANAAVGADLARLLRRFEGEAPAGAGEHHASS